MAKKKSGGGKGTSGEGGSPVVPKKKSGGGKGTSGEGQTSTGLIVTLIFFILATFIAGTFAYVFSNESKASVLREAAAKKDADNFKKVAEQNRMLHIISRIALNTESLEDRKTVESLLQSNNKDFLALLQEEHNKLYYQVSDSLKNVDKDRDPERAKAIADYLAPNSETLKLLSDDFKWDVVGDKPAPGPRKSLPQLLREYAAVIRVEQAARDNANKAEQDVQKKLEVSIAANAAIKKSYDDNLAKQKADYDKDVAEKETRIAALNAKVGAAAAEQAALTRTSAVEKEKLSDNLQKVTKDNVEIRTRAEEYQKRLLEQTADLLTSDKAKAKVVKRDGDYVQLDLGRSANLRERVTFSVLPRDATWTGEVDFLKRLDKARDRNRNATPEQVGIATKDMRVKGAIEVIEILGPSLARAKITYETDGIRDRIKEGDELHNPIWNPGVQDHIAFAGLVDLDGDGQDDNEDFMRILARNGVVIDEYLDLRERAVKGPGMSASTKYLVVGPSPDVSLSSAIGTNNPRTAAITAAQVKMADMMTKARERGIQIISDKKFLVLIGVKLPPRALSADYGSPRYLDPSSVPAPTDTKKDEGK